ncbi:hypothetical protein NDU88_007219 [Pleurodeles waltl]|uniref:Uncharacterized protein n=1 Tax=Pleurodeles waltl TaxID=8319 RepID=A0AAV7SRZ6_PLEWA|nr:hypothetical protein NDU88_007219 [Pleurodeles waltl]
MRSRRSQPASRGNVAASGQAHRVKRGPQRGPPFQTRGPGAGEQAPPHLRRSPSLHSGRRARTQRVGNPPAAPDAAATAQEVPRHDGSGKRGPGSTDLTGHARDHN